MDVFAFLQLELLLLHGFFSDTSVISYLKFGSAFPPVNEFFFVSRTCDGQNLTLPPELP